MSRVGWLTFRRFARRRSVMGAFGVRAGEAQMPKQKAANSSILEEGSTFSDLHSAVLDSTTKLPYPEEVVRERLELTSQQLLAKRNKQVYGNRKKSTGKISFDHIPIENQAVLLFPGQGSQFVGMGSKVVDCEAAKRLFDEASEVLKYDLLKLCAEGPATKLEQTIYCQPAVFVSELAALEKMKAADAELADNITDVAGFSVGEFSALVAGGILSFSDAIKIVKVRCEAMHECNKLIKSGMATIRVNAKSRLEEAMKIAKQEARERGEMEVCEVANFLYCGVRVIGASETCMNSLVHNQKQFEFQIVKQLAVSGAFHTCQMEQAVEKVRHAVAAADIQYASCNVYSNYTGQVFPPRKGEIRMSIAKQVTNAVKWEQIQQLLYRKHQDFRFPRYIEVGPGRQLGAMLLQTSKKAYKHYEHYSC